MKLIIEKILNPLKEKNASPTAEKPWTLSWTSVEGTLDGKPICCVVKAWNGDAKRIAVGAELEVKLDEKASSGEVAYVVLQERKPGGKGGFGGGAGRGGLTPMQFLLDQRAKMAIAALEGAVELTKGLGDKVKAIPLANMMFDWLIDKSLIKIEEKKEQEG